MSLSRLVFTIFGPSGAGKSSTVRAFPPNWGKYIEDASENPHLEQFLSEEDSFNAFRSQRWFLEQIQEYLSVNLNRPLMVLDQDPLAIVEVYSNLFLEQKLISQREFEDLQDMLKVLEEMLGIREMIFLDAPAAVLRSRVALRDGEIRTPPLEWFESISSGFNLLRGKFPECHHIDTSELSKGQLKREIAKYVEARVKLARAGATVEERHS